MIHQYSIKEITSTRGRIDKIYFCTDLEQTSPNRKPNDGMGSQAKKEFQQINFAKSIMVGNKIADTKFGRNPGCKTVFLPTTNPETDPAENQICAVFNSLIGFAKTL